MRLKNNPIGDSKKHQIFSEPFQYSHYCPIEKIYRLDLKPPRLIREEHASNIDTSKLMGLCNYNVLICIGQLSEQLDFLKSFFLSVQDETLYEEFQYKFILTPNEQIETQQYSHIIFDSTFAEFFPSQLKKYILQSNMVSYFDCFTKNQNIINLSINSIGSDYWFFRISPHLSPFSKGYYLMRFLATHYSHHKFENAKTAIINKSEVVV